MRKSKAGEKPEDWRETKRRQNDVDALNEEAWKKPRRLAWLAQ
jgi:hypothetical protein